MEGNTEFQEAQKQSMPPESVPPLVEGGLVKGLEDKFNGALEQERKPTEPKISIRIFYSAHGSAKDLKGLKEEFAKCDIYMSERYEWTEGTLDIFKRLSSGMMSPSEVEVDEDPVIQERERLIDEMIYKSQKPIAFIDVPENHQIIKDEESRQSQNKGKKIFHYGNFDQTLESFKNVLKSGFLDKERETYMLSQLKPQVEAILKEHPNLRDRQEIRVLLSLGAGHTSLYHSLKKENFQITRVFSNKPLVYPFSLEVIRRYAFGKPVDDELLGRALTENLFWKAFKPQVAELTEHDSQKATKFIRRLISAFSFDEIKNMFESVERFEDWPKKFVSGLKQKGLRIPSSEQELDEFLAKLMPRSDAIKERGLGH